MTALHTASDYQALLGNTQDDEVLRLAQYLNNVQMPLQTRCDNGQQSRLLQLPQELRDHIVRVSLPSAINIDPYGVSQETAPPAWLQVCSQMRLDAAKVYFRTPIQLPYISDEKFKAWVESIDASYRVFVRSIQIDRFFGTLDGAMEYAHKQDNTGAFRPGTVWATTSVVEDGNPFIMWINARGETKPYIATPTGGGAEDYDDECAVMNCWD